MRTTLTIDPDVQALLEKAQKEQHLSFKEVANDAMRKGLLMGLEKKQPPKISLREFDIGRPLIGNLDNIAEVLAIAEGEQYK